MTKFTLTIDTSGPAFGEWQTEAARILRAVADDLDRDDGRAEAQAAPIPDRFGSPCGLWSHGKELTTTSEQVRAELFTALTMAVRALQDHDIDESMAGEFEILTDALEHAQDGDIGALYAALSGAKPT